MQALAPLFSARLTAVLACLALLLSACLVTPDDASEPGAEDVCTGTFHAYAESASRDACSAAGRGEWIDGRCYCHGE